MSRRGAGEGSIYQRADGRWVGTASIGWKDGRRARRSVYGKTRAEVAKRQRKLLETIEAGRPVASERLSVGEWLSTWLTEHAPKTARPTTLAAYRNIVSHHLVPALGTVRLAKLRPADVAAYCDEKLASGLSARSVEQHHAVLRRALTVAMSLELIERNVVRIVAAPHPRREEVRPLTPDQAKVFLAAVKGHRFEVLFQVTMALGLRRSEVLGLTWSAIDLDGGSLTVRTALHRYDRAYHLDQPKTARSARTLQLARPLVEALSAQRTNQLAERQRAGSAWQGDSWNLVFAREDGYPLDGAVVTTTFQQILAAAGLPRMRFHDLRHGAATYMLATGVPLRVAMQVLGHSGIAITSDLYSHVLVEAEQDAADRVAAALFGGM